MKLFSSLKIVNCKLKISYGFTSFLTLLVLSVLGIAAGPTILKNIAQINPGNNNVSHTASNSKIADESIGQYSSKLGGIVKFSTPIFENSSNPSNGKTFVCTDSDKIAWYTDGKQASSNPLGILQNCKDYNSNTECKKNGVSLYCVDTKPACETLNTDKSACDDQGGRCFFYQGGQGESPHCVTDNGNKGGLCPGGVGYCYGNKGPSGKPQGCFYDSGKYFCSESSLGSLSYRVIFKDPNHVEYSYYSIRAVDSDNQEVFNQTSDPSTGTSVDNKFEGTWPKPVPYGTYTIYLNVYNLNKQQVGHDSFTVVIDKPNDSKDFTLTITGEGAPANPGTNDCGTQNCTNSQTCVKDPAGSPNPHCIDKLSRGDTGYCNGIDDQVNTEVCKPGYYCSNGTKTCVSSGGSTQPTTATITVNGSFSNANGVKVDFIKYTISDMDGTDVGGTPYQKTFNSTSSNYTYSVTTTALETGKEYEIYYPLAVIIKNGTAINSAISTKPNSTSCHFKSGYPNVCFITLSQNTSISYAGDVDWSVNDTPGGPGGDTCSSHTDFKSCNDQSACFWYTEHIGVSPHCVTGSKTGLPTCNSSKLNPPWIGYCKTGEICDPNAKVPGSSDTSEACVTSSSGAKPAAPKGVDKKAYCYQGNQIAIDFEGSPGFTEVRYNAGGSYKGNSTNKSDYETIYPNTNNKATARGFTPGNDVYWDVYSCNSAGCTQSSNGYFIFSKEEIGNPCASSSGPGTQPPGSDNGSGATGICVGKGGVNETVYQKGYVAPICMTTTPTSTNYTDGLFSASKASASPNPYKDGKYYNVYQCVNSGQYDFAPTGGSTGICNTPPWVASTAITPPPGTTCKDPTSYWDGTKCTFRPDACANIGPKGKQNTCQASACAAGMTPDTNASQAEANLACADSYGAGRGVCCLASATGTPPGTNPGGVTSTVAKATLTACTSGNYQNVTVSWSPITPGYSYKLNWPPYWTHTFVDGKSSFEVTGLGAGTGYSWSLETIDASGKTIGNDPGTYKTPTSLAACNGSSTAPAPGTPGGGSGSTCSTSGSACGPSSDYACYRGWQNSSSSSNALYCCPFTQRYCEATNSCMSSQSQCAPASTAPAPGTPPSTGSGQGTAGSHCYNGDSDCEGHYKCSSNPGTATSQCVYKNPSEVGAYCYTGSGAHYCSTTSTGCNQAGLLAGDNYACQKAGQGSYCCVGGGSSAPNPGGGSSNSSTPLPALTSCDGSARTSCGDSTTPDKGTNWCGGNYHYVSGDASCTAQGKYCYVCDAGSTASNGNEVKISNFCTTNKQCATVNPGSACVFTNNPNKGVCR